MKTTTVIAIATLMSCCVLSAAVARDREQPAKDRAPSQENNSASYSDDMKALQEQTRQLQIETQRLLEQIRVLVERQRQLAELQMPQTGGQLQAQSDSLRMHRRALESQSNALQQAQSELQRLARDLPKWRDDEGSFRIAVSRKEHIIEGLSSAKLLEVVNDIGSITVRGGDGQTGRIIATVRGMAQTEAEARELADKVGVILTPAGDRICVTATKPQDLSPQERGNYSLAIEVTVPRNARVKVNQGFGDVRLLGLAGSIEAGTSMGTIWATEVRGRVALTVSFGDIDFVAAKDLSSKVYARSDFGSVQSDLPLHAVKPGDFSMGGQASGTIGQGEGDISLMTKMGTIRIRTRVPDPNGL